MKRIVIVLTLLALLALPAISRKQVSYAGTGSTVFLPMVIGSNNNPRPTEWTPAQKAEIASIVENGGVLQKLYDDIDQKTDKTIKQTDGNYEYWINTENHYVVRNTSDLLYLGLNDDVIWPGALIKGTNAHDFVYEPILLPRAPLTLSANLEHVSCAGNLTETVVDPKLSTMREGIRMLLQEARDNCTPVSAQAQYINMNVYSASHMNMMLSANVSYGAGNLDERFDWNNTSIKTRIVSKYYQVFYTIDINTPTSQADFFDATRTSLYEIATAMPPGSKPMYVAGIKYGMMALMFFESTYEESIMDQALNVAYSDGNLDTEIRTGLTSRDVLVNSNIEIVVYGGSTAGLTDIYTGLPGFQAVIHASATAGPDAPGVPLAYKFRHFSNNLLALITQTSDYAITLNRFPLTPVIRVILKFMETTMVDDEGTDNRIEMDRFFLYAFPYNRESASETVPPDYDRRTIVEYFDPGWVTMNNGSQWPSYASGLQGAYFTDIIYDNASPEAGGHDFDYAFLRLAASARDYDTGSADEWGDGNKFIFTGQDILNGIGSDLIFEIVSSDFRINVHVAIQLLNP